ncbi:hypothetical protein [Rhodohalobacter sp. 8-1]|uniref:hypothetical protein n=1 Tax=Rhodohalobacter sp. 8-1 TaxID=3131972 RepID=UPI0030EC346A
MMKFSKNQVIFSLKSHSQSKKKNPQKHSLKKIKDSLFDAAGNSDSDQFNHKRYDFLYSLLEVLDDVDKKDTLQQFLD